MVHLCIYFHTTMVSDTVIAHSVSPLILLAKRDLDNSSVVSDKQPGSVQLCESGRVEMNCGPCENILGQ